MWAQFLSRTSNASVPSPKEVGLGWNIWIRRVHRWLAIAFTLTVAANFVAMAQGDVPALITYSPLPPLFLLMFTGMYMFALPYAAAWKRRRDKAA